MARLSAKKGSFAANYTRRLHRYDQHHQAPDLALLEVHPFRVQLPDHRSVRLQRRYSLGIGRSCNRRAFEGMVVNVRGQFDASSVEGLLTRVSGRRYFAQKSLGVFFRCASSRENHGASRPAPKDRPARGRTSDIASLPPRTVGAVSPPVAPPCEGLLSVLPTAVSAVSVMLKPELSR